MDNKEIKQVKLLRVVKISTFLMRIFNEEDGDWPDRRKIAIWERNIDKNLSYFTEDKNEQHKIRDIISSENWNFKDRTYKTMCDRIRELGYKILEGEQ